MAGTSKSVNYGSWPRKLLTGEDKRILTDRAVEGVREAIKAAEDCGVLFCVEVVNRFEQFIMNTAAELPATEPDGGRRDPVAIPSAAAVAARRSRFVPHPVNRAQTL